MPGARLMGFPVVALAGILWLPACSGPPIVEEVLAVNQIRLSSGTLVTYAGLEESAPGGETFEESRLANESLVLGKTVSLVAARAIENGDAVEAFVYTPVVADGKTQQLFVNRELALFGYARASKVVPPDALEPDLWGDVAAAGKTAKEEGVGLWAEKSAGARE